MKRNWSVCKLAIKEVFKLYVNIVSYFSCKSDIRFDTAPEK